ncbi:hypothetical protein DFO67_108190 [Modicisalibacter xianhensis]|uniref:Uncharacterized protein n=1 Tax=Modicisalibacter xianhensis TaxID=442341 RepID=A0A4R8G221_9GAMM|nr:hypothetical protein [Halomonas xianhensis]TDX29146.1 hypothetical protein DFO67_108190 [Halomonas xianhensis]
MPHKPSIDSLSVWLNKSAIQQAFTTIVCPILEAKAVVKASGKEEAVKLCGDGKHDYPVAGEVTIGHTGDLVVKLIVEPASGGYSGEVLYHDEINAIGISDMVVDGQRLKQKEQ